MRARVLASAVSALALALGTLFPVAPVQAASGHTVTPLWFTTHVGADGTQECMVVADLYLPESASSTNRVPAILTTNGFGGSKDDQAGMAESYADRGYAVLSYSGLGFGGSGCSIELDNPEIDGKAAQQLIDYLAGATGIAYTDADRTQAAPALDVVTLDAAGDPRVGMVGVSYGGSIQFATAAIDQRVDAIVPIATWHDLRYSLSPNNLVPSATQPETPGAAKLFWALGFSAKGITGGIEDIPADPGRVDSCANFADFVCPALVTAGATGFIDDAAAEEMVARSTAGYGSTITAPTLLVQGQADTLFNLNEAIDGYRMLSEQGTEVKMIWAHGGHSAPVAPGELDLAADPAETYIGGRVADWFDHYLKDLPVDTGAEFAYFRDWVDYDGNAAPAFAESDTVDVAIPEQLYLSDSELTPDATAIADGTATFLTPPAGAPTSTDPADVVSSLMEEYFSVPETDLPGTFATYTTSPLAGDLDVVGTPVLDLQVSAPAAEATQALGPAGQLVLFAKISEVAADGSVDIVGNLVAPVRIPDVTKPFTVRMPAFAHRFETGNQIRLTISGGSTNYRGGFLDVSPVTIATGSADQVLTLPALQAFPGVVPPTDVTGSDGDEDSDTASVADQGGTGLVGGTGVVTTAAAADDHLPRTGATARLAVLLLGMALIAAGCAALTRRVVSADPVSARLR
ncbi:MAG: alpha/beta fold hydrolase [Aeromicrobium sp.]|uniref:alpha/beta fold hydrolase n=1 Tax=Aeromicrobium sp. TaxID=1871063 RepID=UPI0039E51DF8